MIEKVVKVLFYGLKNECDAFFEKAQMGGIFEFIGSEKKVVDIQAPVKDILFALKILRKLPCAKKQSTENANPEYIVKEILDIQQNIEKLKENERLSEQEIARILPYGNFSMDLVRYLKDQGNRFLQYFCIKTSKREKISLPKELIYVNTMYDLDYYIAVNKEKKSYPHMIELNFERSLQDERNKLAGILKEIKLNEEKLNTYVFYQKLLKKSLIKNLNAYNLQSAKKVSQEHENVIFAINAWIPEKFLEKAKEIIKDINVDFEIIQTEKNDRIPTYMENKKTAKIGEDLVNIYDVPAPNDKDPSLWVLIAFSLFFAIIVSDAGYGFVYFLIGLFLKFKFPKAKRVLKRFTHLIFILSASCMIWGACIGSFFGVGITPANKLSKYTIINYLSEKKANYHLQQKDDVYDFWKSEYSNIANAKDGKEFILIATRKDDGKVIYEALNVFQKNILMELSLLIGVIHIILSLLRYQNRHYPAIGWVLFIIGGYLFFPKILNATSILHFLNVYSKNFAQLWGYWILMGGLILAVILGFIQDRLKGFIEITKMISIFADILSYLRLYALGLAGAIMASTFNDIGQSMPWVFGIFVIILGHTITLSLNIMGGVIHGLRLNFIEWYHYSFVGDGKLFNPLKLIKFN